MDKGSPLVPAMGQPGSVSAIRKVCVGLSVILSRRSNGVPACPISSSPFIPAVLWARHFPARFQALAGPSRCGLDLGLSATTLPPASLPPPGVGWTSGSWFDPAERAAVEANEKARLDALRADKKLPKV